MLKNALRLLFFCAFLMVGCTAIAQTSSSLAAQNIASVKIDELSDAQLKQYLNRAKASGYTDAQLETELLNNGMSPDELQKLRVRIEKIRQEEETAVNEQLSKSSQAKPIRNYTKAKDSVLLRRNQDNLLDIVRELSPKIYGAELFSNPDLTFEPSVNIPTPRNYVIGPGDELVVDVWGLSQKTYREKVNAEGNVRLEVVGLIAVNGLTIEQASDRIINRLSQYYGGLRSYPKTTFAQVTLGSIRSIRVSVLGEARLPGTYTLSSLSTVLNALYACGGPSNNGTYRSIEIIRNNKVIRRLDVYDLLLAGTSKDNIKLEDQDIIRIPAYQNRVEVCGEVKRPGFYEVNGKESLAKLIEYTGGFTNAAYTERINIVRNSPKDYSVADVVKSAYPQFLPIGGDKFTVGKIIERFANRVQIAGAVFRPGIYSLETNPSISALIKSAEGLKEDAFLPHATLFRRNAQLELEARSVDLSTLTSGTVNDISLQREDSLVVYSRFALQEVKYVAIDGFVQHPNKYPYAEGMSVADLILEAGGMKEGASITRVEVSRQVRNPDELSSTADVARVFLVDLDAKLNQKGSEFKLMPFDVVSVRRMQGFVNERKVTVEGEVNFPGNYAIANKVERISSVINRAGGLSKESYAQGAYLVRTRKLSELEMDKRRQQLFKIQNSTQEGDSSVLEDHAAELLDMREQVGIKLQKIVKHPGSKYDLILQDGDLIKIPTQLQTVKVSGEILHPVSIRYAASKSARGYINNAGGFGDKSLKRRTYVIYANGSVRSTHNYIFFNDFPKVKPGSEIFVPARQIRQRSPQESIAISSAVATLALTIISIINLTR